jgi:hypothetical protein
MTALSPNERRERKNREVRRRNKRLKKDNQQRQKAYRSRSPVILLDESEKAHGKIFYLL